VTDRELMQQALEALIGARAFLESDAPVEIWGVNDKAITALRERLTQPQRTHWEGCEDVHPECKKQETVMAEYKFQTYAAYQTDGEMKIGVVPAMKEGKDFTISKPWVGLTDEDCVEAIDENFDFALDHGNVSNASVIRYARAIEAKLKEKNA
jgi:hypothetical protein